MLHTAAGVPRPRAGDDLSELIAFLETGELPWPEPGGALAALGDALHRLARGTLDRAGPGRFGDCDARARAMPLAASATGRCMSYSVEWK